MSGRSAKALRRAVARIRAVLSTDDLREAPRWSTHELVWVAYGIERGVIRSRKRLPVGPMTRAVLRALRPDEVVGLGPLGNGGSNRRARRRDSASEGRGPHGLDSRGAVNRRRRRLPPSARGGRRG